MCYTFCCKSTGDNFPYNGEWFTPFFCRNRRKLNSYRRRERKDHDKSSDFYSLQRILREKTTVDAPNRHFLLRETEWRLDRGRKKTLVDFVQKRIVLNRLLWKDRFCWNGWAHPSIVIPRPCPILVQNCTKKSPPILVLFNQISFVKRGFIVHLAAAGRFQNSRKGSTKEGFFLPISSSQKIGGGLSNVSIKILCGGSGVRHNSTELRKFVSRAPFLLPSLPPPPPFLSLVKNFGNSKLFYSFGRSKKAKFQFVRRPWSVAAAFGPNSLGKLNSPYFPPQTKRKKEKFWGKQEDKHTRALLFLALFAASVYTCGERKKYKLRDMRLFPTRRGKRKIFFLFFPRRKQINISLIHRGIAQFGVLLLLLRVQNLQSPALDFFHKFSRASSFRKSEKLSDSRSCSGKKRRNIDIYYSPKWR